MGNWFNQDGLFIQYGPDKAKPTTAGDYLSLGETREIELTIDLTTLTASPVIQAQTTIFGAPNMFIEQVELVADVAASGGTSFSVGLVNMDRTTVLSNTAFVSGVLTATMTPAGKKVILTNGATGAGAYVGGYSASPGYITALASGTFTTGQIKVRIKYRGTGTITQ